MITFADLAREIDPDAWDKYPTQYQIELSPIWRNRAQRYRGRQRKALKQAVAVAASLAATPTNPTFTGI